ncbi:TerB family tellurite resistance protein [Salaquimonas pukyongi]|uniref:TerB family tellurite resistance protein n=1 Tax=Salaquimonas pukyongi TaxID=2712698 RepID=UPI00096B8978|nr:TerB family tellurite resistance protein [Salaquimonas pukyongi]
MSEPANSIPHLLAEMAAADGKVLQVEELNAEALIECFGAQLSVEDAKARFFASLKAEVTETDPQKMMAHFARLPVEVKLDLFRAVWMVAICDGELHPSEERLAQRFADMIALGRTDETPNPAAADDTIIEMRFQKAG